MIRRNILTLIFLILIIGCTNDSYTPIVKEPISEDLSSILEKFTGDTLTDLQKTELWKQYEGELVEGSAYVHNVDKNMLGTLVVLADLQPRGPYEITSDLALFFKKSELDNLLKLSEGQKIHFKGELSDYHDIMGNLDIVDTVLIAQSTKTSTAVRDIKSKDSVAIPNKDYTDFQKKSTEISAILESLALLMGKVTAAIKNEEDIQTIQTHAQNFVLKYEQYRPELVEFYEWMIDNPESIPPELSAYPNELFSLIVGIDESYTLSRDRFGAVAKLDLSDSYFKN